jgi:hypothetical protein
LIERVLGFDNPTRSPEGVPCRELEHKLQNVLMFSTAIFSAVTQGAVCQELEHKLQNVLMFSSGDIF